MVKTADSAAAAAAAAATTAAYVSCSLWLPVDDGAITWVLTSHQAP